MSIKTEPYADTINELKKPNLFMVIFYNDDYTEMYFVVSLLVHIFNKDVDEAFAIMFSVHKTGKATVGIYTYDIAVTKKMQADKLSEQNGYPLKITVEEVS